MKQGPEISRIASLVGDPARGNMLTTLMDGRALTASELAASAGITKQTASTHLAKLLDGALVAREIQGRHHYYRLASADVAMALEALMGLANTTTGKRTRTGPKEPALRKARICYDHLAGELGVRMFEKMQGAKWLTLTEEGLHLSPKGWKALAKIDLTPADLATTKRPECRACLDWSERRHHLAGRAGKMLLDRFQELGWAKRQPDSRIITFSAPGERKFHQWLGK
jgi:DNA-binding transcriptional ArsR family regulator